MVRMCCPLTFNKCIVSRCNPTALDASRPAGVQYIYITSVESEGRISSKQRVVLGTNSVRCCYGVCQSQSNAYCAPMKLRREGTQQTQPQTRAPTPFLWVPWASIRMYWQAVTSQYTGVMFASSGITM